MRRRSFIKGMLATPIIYTSATGLLSACATKKSSSSEKEETDRSRLLALTCSERNAPVDLMITSPKQAYNVFQFEEAARMKLDSPTFTYLACGAEDNRTLIENRRAFDKIRMRARRLVNVKTLDTSLQLFGRKYSNPIFLSPCGLMSAFHSEAEIAVAKAAQNKDHLMVLSTVASRTYEQIKEINQNDVWFQLYPTPDREVTRMLISRVERAGCPVMLLTVDSPVLGLREKSNLFNPLFKKIVMEGGVGHFNGLKPTDPLDPTLTWDFIRWLRSNTKMRIVVKGIVTGEDASLALKHGVDGIMVSNHGGRQEESGRSSMESLAEVVRVVQEKVPVLVDGGIRRGSDVYKALALGATAVGIGRSYLWGLSSFGQEGVEKVLELTRSELEQTMKLMGTPTLKDITKSSLSV